MTTLRAFVAIDLPGPVRTALGDVIERLARRTPAGVVRWVRPGSIHLTLKFLGDVPAASVAALGQALAAGAHSHGPFDLRLAGLSAFPHPQRPRVLWLGVGDTSGGLAGLQRDLEARLAALGHPPEARGFSPHLTLGRLRREASPRQAQQVGEALLAEGALDLGEIAVTSVELFRSELRPTGAVYHRLAEARLEAGG